MNKISAAAHSMLTGVRDAAATSQAKGYGDGAEVWSQVTPLLPTKLVRRPYMHVAQRDIVDMGQSQEILDELRTAKLITSKGRGDAMMRMWNVSAKGGKYLTKHGDGLLRDGIVASTLLTRYMRTGMNDSSKHYDYDRSWLRARDFVCNSTGHAFSREQRERGEEDKCNTGKALSHMTQNISAAIESVFHDADISRPVIKGETVKSHHLSDKQLFELLISTYRVLSGMDFIYKGKWAAQSALWAGYDPLLCRQACTDDYGLCHQSIGFHRYHHSDVHIEIVCENKKNFELRVEDIVLGLLTGEIECPYEFEIPPHELAAAAVQSMIDKRAKTRKQLTALVKATASGKITWSTGQTQAEWGRGSRLAPYHGVYFKDRSYSVVRASKLNLRGIEGDQYCTLHCREGMQLLGLIDKLSPLVADTSHLIAQA